MKYQVVEKISNCWNDSCKLRVVLETDSEVLAYKEALSNQRLSYNDAGSPFTVEYMVIKNV